MYVTTFDQQGIAFFPKQEIIDVIATSKEAYELRIKFCIA